MLVVLILEAVRANGQPGHQKCQIETLRGSKKLIDNFCL